MFRCQICEEVVEPGTPAQSIVVSQRSKEYPTRTVEVVGPRGNNRRSKTIDRGGQGEEIARELTVCPICAEKYGMDEEE